MNINEVRTAFKIMDAKLSLDEKINFIYLDNLITIDGKRIDKKILRENYSRVYIIVVNDQIYKIGASESKGGIINTLQIYKDGGVKGRPSIRSYGVYRLILEELRNNNKVSFYMIYQEPLKTYVKGLFKIENESDINISAKAIEEMCISDYLRESQGKYPIWNFQEQGLDWPAHIKDEHAKIISDSTLRPGRNKGE